MSKRLDPLCECVGVRKPADAVYDPAENLACLDKGFPGCGLYLAQLPFKRDWAPLLTRTGAMAEPAHLRTLPTADP